MKKLLLEDLFHTMSTEEIPSNFSGKCMREGCESYIGHYKYGVLHREDGPAVEYTESFIFYLIDDEIACKKGKRDSEFWLFGRKRDTKEYVAILETLGKDNAFIAKVLGADE
jgi:hypothetical protein